MALVNVSAVIVTRGDVDLSPVVQSLPEEWETLVWDNGHGNRDPGLYRRITKSGLLARRVLGLEEYPDLSVYGRYAAIEHASHDLIYVQDDDCIVSDPRAIVDTWRDSFPAHEYIRPELKRPDGGFWGAQSSSLPCVGLAQVDCAHPLHAAHVVCNMPPEFRYDFYADHALVGFGACFHRDAPTRAFERFFKGVGAEFSDWRETVETLRMAEDFGFRSSENFLRTCDIVFTALTPRVLVDVPKTNLWWAEDESRMYRQPQHTEERARMLELVKEVRDAR